MADGVAVSRKLAQSELRPSVVHLLDADAAVFLRDNPEHHSGPLLLLSFHGRNANERAQEALAVYEGVRAMKH